MLKLWLSKQTNVHPSKTASTESDQVQNFFCSKSETFCESPIQTSQTIVESKLLEFAFLFLFVFVRAFCLGICHSMFAKAPSLDWALIRAHLSSAYPSVDLRGEWRAVSGERDQNIVIDNRLVVKITAPNEHTNFECQAKALRHIQQFSTPDGSLRTVVPLVVPTGAGALTSMCPHAEQIFPVLLLTYREGVTMHDSSFLNEQLEGFSSRLTSFGTITGELTRSLRGFVHPAPASRTLLWHTMSAAEQYIPVLSSTSNAEIEVALDEDKRKRSLQLLEDFRDRVLPQLMGLRAQILHGDVHPHNTIVDPSRLNVTGVIDFGDMVHGPLVLELGNCLADTLDTCEVAFDKLALPIVRGYVSVVPLEEAELDVLLDVVVIRLLSTYLGLTAKTSKLGETGVAAGFGNRTWQRLDELAVNRTHFLAVIRRAGLFPSSLTTSISTSSSSSSSSTSVDLVDKIEAVLARRRRVLGDRLRLFYSPKPCQMVRGAGVWLFDSEGRRFLDLYNNVVSVGHCHPYVAEAVVRQCRTLNTNTRYLTNGAIEYAERLLANQHPSLDRVLFVNSGSEANDLAYRIAKTWTGGKTGGLTMEFGYHGITDALDGFTPSNLRPHSVAPVHVRQIPPPDLYRGPYRRSTSHGAADRCTNEGEEDISASLGAKYAELIEPHIAYLNDAGHGLACAMIDSMFMSNGVLEAPDGYLRLVSERVRAHGGLYIADEVQSGFCRTGTHFWGYQKHGVVPDIVTIGKPAGNGIPVGAVITRSEILERFTDRTSFFSTFGGNNVSCAAGLAVLDVLRDEDLLANCQRVGAHLKHGLSLLMLKHEIIGDVRGFGLAIGVELVRDRETKEPATQETQEILRLIRDEGCLVGSEGTADNCIKVRPPLVITIEQADFAISCFDAALSKFSRQ